MCRSKLENIRKYDIFGVDVGLTFQEHEHYYTKVGGCLTLLIFTLLLGNFVQEMIYFFTAQTYRKDVSKTYNEYVSGVS